MEARMRVLTALLMAFCVGIASASSPAAPISSSPSRSLLGSQLGYIPSGCPLTVSVSAEESDPSWFQDAPEIRGVVTLSNPTSYTVPLDNIVVQARSSNGLLYSTMVYCDGNVSPTVPYNPEPYTYGTLTCRYRLVLDRNVFGSYGQSGSRKLLGTGIVQANFFPGGSSGSSSSSGSGGGYGYFPPPSQRLTWTVTAIVTVQYSNAQCLSAPTPVNTDCWWSWLSSWAQKHHHNWSWLFGSGRKLLMRLAGGETLLVGQQTQQAGADSSSVVSRSLLSSYSEGSFGDSGSEHREHRHHHHHHHMHSSSSNSGSYSSGGYSSGSDSGRSLLHSQSEHNSGNSASEHRHHHHNHHHYLSSEHNSGSFSSGFSSGTDSGRSLLSTQDSGSQHREHKHHHHHHRMHSSSSGSYSSGSGRSLLHSEGASNFGSEGSVHSHRHHHNHHHHMSSEHNSGSYSSGSDSSSGRSLLNSHVQVLRDGHGVAHGGMRTHSGFQWSQGDVLPAGQTLSDMDDTVDDIEQQATDISSGDSE